MDKAVTPFRLIVDYNLTADQIMAGWENGQIFYVGDIPLSYRSQYAKKAEVSDEMSTHTYYLNENAEINGKKLFAIDVACAVGISDWSCVGCHFDGS